MVNRIRDDAAQYLASKVCQGRFMPFDLRDVYVEALVCCALRDAFPDAGWKPAEDGAPWDLEDDNYTYLQVKQASALSQIPGSECSERARPLFFDIHPGKLGRQTHLYVFAWHPEGNPDIADHRDAGQWRFCVMPEDELPEPAVQQKTQRISLGRLQVLAKRLGLQPTIPYWELANTINHIASVILEADLKDARQAEEALERIQRGEERTYSSQEVMAKLGLGS